MARTGFGKLALPASLLLASVCVSAAPEDPNTIFPLLNTAGADTAKPADSAPDPVEQDPNEPAASQVEDSAAQTAQTSPDTPSPAESDSTPPEAESTADATDATDKPAQATEAPAKTATADVSAADQAMSMSQVIALLQAQQKELADQRKLIEKQSNQIKLMNNELDVLRAPLPSQSGELVAKTETVTQPLTKDTLQESTVEPSEKTATEVKQATGEAVAKAQADDPTRDLLSSFPGAWRLPGTDAALAIGGYVKTSMVYNFDPLEIRDRFIVGSIPVGDDRDVEAQSSLTASQSRLNFDLREPTEYGLLRAFIEGDFASDNDTFRLRHAFGQWKKVLAGKTWSAFVDTEATPEEVDFEGLNGRINVRQSQVRIMPTIGQSYEFQLSIEDPNPQIQNGKGVTRAPDIITSARFNVLDRIHVKLGVIGRQIRGQTREFSGGGLDKQYAWGTTLSGRFATPRFDKRDSLLFQLNVGNGIGRYVNDLSSVGSFDGIFDPETGKLKLFDIVAGYASWQHWWEGSIRSNFTVGFVDVDNPSFVEGTAYKRTLRASANIFWMPTPRIDIGAEYLWGNRKNEDGRNDDATQIQLAARYRF